MLTHIRIILTYYLIFSLTLSFGFGFNSKTWSVSLCIAVVLAVIIDMVKKLNKVSKASSSRDNSSNTKTLNFPRRRLLDITFKNIWLLIKDQMPIKNLIYQLYKGQLLRKFNLRSHLRDTGESKIMYAKRSSAMKAKISMESKNRGTEFTVYKCLYCRGFHLGANKYKLDK